MTPFPRMFSTLRKQSCIGFIVAFAAINLLAKSQPPTSVYSEISPEYERTALEGGGYEAETYVFGKGVCLDEKGTDESLSSMSFWDVAQVIAESLYEADYIPTPNPKETDLMIVLNWGRTNPSVDGIGGLEIDSLAAAMNGASETGAMAAEAASETPTTRWETQTQAGEMHKLHQTQLSKQYEQLEQMLVMQGMGDDARSDANAFNARLLGYQEVLQRSSELANSVTPIRNYIRDAMHELESPRYFVILQAYDFETAFKEKKKKLLWTSRFSISAEGRDFAEELRNMAMASARLFGTDSKSLRRKLTPGRVEFGELEYMGVEEE